MPRLTITLSEERHRALKESALRRGKSIAALVEESLDFYGIKSTRSAAELVAAARNRAGLAESAALEVALAEVDAARHR